MVKRRSCLVPDYCCTLVVSGLVLRLAALTDHSSLYVHIMLQIYNLYVQVGAVLFLLYLLVAIHHYLEKHPPLEEPLETQPSRGRHQTPSLHWVSSHWGHQGDCVKPVLPVAYRGEHMNGLLRVVLVVLSLCSMVREVLSIVVLYQSYTQCFRWYNMATSLLRLGLFMLQTGTIIKHFRIIINFRYKTVRLGLGHMIAANLVTWYTDVIQKSHDDLQPHSEDLVRSGLNESISQVVCLQVKESSMAQGGAYLYPLTVQYCLLCVSLLYKMYRHTGVSTIIDTHTPTTHMSLMEQLSRTRGQVCHTLAIICGLCVFVAAVAGSVMFVVYTEAKCTLEAHMATAVIYLSSDISCNLMGISVCTVMLTMKKRLHSTEVNNAIFGDSHLTFSYVGAFGFTFMVLIGQIAAAAERGLDTVISFSLAASILTITQISLQTVTLKAALWRSPYHPGEARSAPSRGWVLLLLFLNLSLWLVNVLELQSLWLKSEFHRKHYGPLLWIVGTNLLLPFATLYRLHSALTLGAIWCRIGVLMSDAHSLVPHHGERVSDRIRRPYGFICYY